MNNISARVDFSRESVHGVAASLEETCPITVSGPTVKGNKTEPRHVVIEPSGMPLNQVCVTRFFVVTATASKGEKKGNALFKYNPIKCETASTASGTPINDFVEVSNVKIFDATANYLLPKGWITQLELVGCP